MCSKLIAVLSFSSFLTIVYANFYFVPPGFGDINSPEVSTEFLRKCQEKCIGMKGVVARCSFTHPKACNLYVECMRFSNIWVLAGRITGPDRLFNEDTGQPELAFSQHERTPILSVCKNNLHPCETLKPVPVNAQQCEGYLLCENGTMVGYRCPEGTGFSAWSGKCDLDCSQKKRRILKSECGPSSKGELYFWFNETVVYGDSTVPQVESGEIGCPAYTSYQVTGKCGCDAYNVTVKPCETITVIHLSSSDNSWELAKSNKPIQGGGSITGEAEIVDPSDRNYGRSAYFNNGNGFLSSYLIGNDLGLYCDLLFTFQIMGDGRTKGLTITRDDSPPLSIALVDNGGDEKEATYGCMLRVERTNQGKIVCYVRPSKATGDKDRNDVTIDSDDVDLRRRISVQFAKDNTRGRLTVRVEGSPEQVKDFRFPTGVRAIGNLSPLVVGTGTGKQPFTGYMDDMYIRKYCGSFM